MCLCVWMVSPRRGGKVGGPISPEGSMWRWCGECASGDRVMRSEGDRVPEAYHGHPILYRRATAALAEARRIKDTTFDAAERSFVSLLSTYTAFVAG